MIRKVGADDFEDLLAIINAASQGYRHNIPGECWNEPYMAAAELAAEIADGVDFYGYVKDERLVGVMGIQEKNGATLIRHAYVRPEEQSKGIGGELLRRLLELVNSPRILVGTWQANTGAVRFYEHNGFVRLPHAESMRLLARHWTITPLQAESSVVLELTH